MLTRRRLKWWLYSSFPPTRGRFKYFGQEVYAPPNCHLIQRAISEGIYELELLNVMRGAIDRDKVHFDVGANIGLMALPILAWYPSISVHSFEPSPNSSAHLLKTRDASAFSSRWIINTVAIGERNGELPFIVHNESQGAFDGAIATGRAQTSRTINVPMKTLDSYWDEIGKPKVSSIKIDVEGYEANALRGASAVLRDQRPSVILEWSRLNLLEQEARYELLSIAESSDYSIYAVPHLQSVRSKADLATMMRFTESFLLMPND